MISSIFNHLAGAVEYTDCFSTKGVRVPHPNESPGYETKQTDGKVPVMLELWGMRITPLISLLPGMVVPDKGSIYGLNETKPWFLEFTVFFFSFKLRIYAKMNWLK